MHRNTINIYTCYINDEMTKTIFLNVTEEVIKAALKVITAMHLYAVGYSITELKEISVFK